MLINGSFIYFSIKKIFLTLFCICILSFFTLLSGCAPKINSNSDGIHLDQIEAKKAFELINKIRENPSLYSSRTGIDLSKIQTTKYLLWNETLTKVAEKKALDMATRNYFSHHSPEKKGINYMIHKAGYKLIKEFRKNNKANYFESIQAGAESGEEAVIDLIIDEGIKDKGHRKHLLGIGKWDQSLIDIGIGFVRSERSKYKTYTCIIIAKQKWL